MMASSSRLKPMEKGKITVTVDVRGKLGKISKTIRVSTNDPNKPMTTLTLSMQVKDSLHIKKYRAEEIFGGQCRRCHADIGRGKKGFELFRADCMMCHNDGKSASPIRIMGKKPREYIINAIRNGIKNTAMPGWDKDSGGNLSDDEIESLADVILKK